MLLRRIRNAPQSVRHGIVEGVPSWGTPAAPRCSDRPRDDGDDLFHARGDDAPSVVEKLHHEPGMYGAHLQEAAAQRAAAELDARVLRKELAAAHQDLSTRRRQHGDVVGAVPGPDRVLFEPVQGAEIDAARPFVIGPPLQIARDRGEPENASIRHRESGRFSHTSWCVCGIVRGTAMIGPTPARIGAVLNWTEELKGAWPRSRADRTPARGYP